MADWAGNMRRMKATSLLCDCCFRVSGDPLVKEGNMAGETARLFYAIAALLV